MGVWVVCVDEVDCDRGLLGCGASGGLMGM